MKESYLVHEERFRVLSLGTQRVTIATDFLRKRLSRLITRRLRLDEFKNVILIFKTEWA